MRDYVVWRAEGHRIAWFWLEHGAYVAQHPVAGQYHCRTFPGLWRHIDAALQGDVAALHAAVDAGCAAAEHRVFLPKLRE